MSAPLFFTDLPGQMAVGDRLKLDGDEGRHAATVKRIQVGENLVLSDGAGRAVLAVTVSVGKNCLEAEVLQVLAAGGSQQQYTWQIVQAIPKGDRQNLAVELATELGANRIVFWQSDRSISRWDEAKRAKAVAKLQLCAREAAKQSRRFTIPKVSFATSGQLASLIGDSSLIAVLHEEADRHISGVQLPQSGLITLVVGPEGGISGEEIQLLTDLGGVTVLISDGILRTSTAGGVGLAQLKLLADLGQVCAKA